MCVWLQARAELWLFGCAGCLQCIWQQQLLVLLEETFHRREVPWAWRGALTSRLQGVLRFAMGHVALVLDVVEGCCLRPP